ncbi:MAG: hypothetical protein IPL12_09565 [Bacteroidetes bacterium]|nr:hypothetical protein [Bacteroidota bacterium]
MEFQCVQTDIPVLQSIQVGADNLQNSVVQQTNSTKSIALIYLIIARRNVCDFHIKIAKHVLVAYQKEKTGNYYLICNEQILQRLLFLTTYLCQG